MKYLIFALCLVTLNAQAEPLKIGALLDLSKNYAPQGEAFRRGIELATDELNQANPGSVEVFVEDTQFQVTNAITAAQRLMAQKKVVAFFTMSAIEQKSVALMAKNSKILTAALWDSSPEIESIGEYSFGFGPWAPATGGKSAQFASGKLGAKTVYIVLQEDEWSESAGNYFKPSFEKLGGKIVGEDKLDPDNADFRSIVAKIKNSSADLVFFPLAKNISQFIKQAKQQNITQKLLTADVLSEEEIKNAQGAAEGVYHMEAGAPLSPKATKLYDLYRKRYKTECELKQFLSWGYDAVLILNDAWLRANKKSGREFEEAVKKTKNLQGASGELAVTDNGSAPKYPTPSVVRDGKLIAVEN